MEIFLRKSPFFCNPKGALLTEVMLERTKVGLTLVLLLISK